MQSSWPELHAGTCLSWCTQLWPQAGRGRREGGVGSSERRRVASGRGTNSAWGAKGESGVTRGRREERVQAIRKPFRRTERRRDVVERDCRGRDAVSWASLAQTPPN